MVKQINWQQILIQCKNNIQKQIAPLLKTLNQPQPNLGIGAGGDPIKQIDLAAEEAIVKTLKEHKISFTLISEESGEKKYGETPNENFVTADPIDGTTNIDRGIPFYATSIAVSTKPILNTIHTALVTDLPHDITYIAQKGKGAYRNYQKIAPSENTSLEKAVIGMDLNTYRVKEIAPKLSSIIQKTNHIRHLGANALELCYVADGTIDAFLDIRGKLRATDTAAAWLIIQEAGAKITTPEGKPLNIKLDPKQKVTFIASANPKIHKLILNFLRREKE
ncbi:MAG: inositol monophosphatase family protein [Candidatus Bathyarchaeota archaeon]|nr:inositol monophosphatase family protein [Candidatus Bathyarchaeota archaeon]MDI6805121.1 inositol monophosphatase family protein [Candidatus Bathyarchaeia archaeon]